MINLILFGPPGSGKGTQAAKLVEQYDLKHISTGDLFRYNLKNETPLGLEAKKYIGKGELVPDTVTINMLKDAVNSNPNVKGFIFDGFPRTVAQADALDAFLQEKNQAVTSLVELVVEEEELVTRLLERGKTSGRKDDQNEATIRNRYQVYKDNTVAVSDYYTTKGKTVKINGMQTIDGVFANICAELDAVVV